MDAFPFTFLYCILRISLIELAIGALALKGEFCDQSTNNYIDSEETMCDIEEED